jgi:hypothetical protein
VPASTVYAIDTSVLELSLSAVRFDVDPFEEFMSNRVRARVKSLAHLAVKQATGICKLTLN